MTPMESWSDSKTPKTQFRPSKRNSNGVELESTSSSYVPYSRHCGCTGCGICPLNARLPAKKKSICFRENDKNETPIERAPRDLFKTVLKLENKD